MNGSVLADDTYIMGADVGIRSINSHDLRRSFVFVGFMRVRI
jgi:hypothetical protein